MSVDIRQTTVTPVVVIGQSLVVEAKDDPDSPLPDLRAVHYDFRLAKAAAGESGRVGADPTKLAAE